MGRLKELDSLRGIACIFVLLFHYTTRYSKLFNTELTINLVDVRFGGMGVDLFFIISGFVIFLTIKKTTTPSEFLFKRFSRLYPTFWICVFLTFFVVRSSDLIIYHRSFSELFLNLSMVPGIFGVDRVDGVYWSLLPELAFYFLMFGLLLTKRTRSIDAISFVWLLATLLNSYRDIMPLRVLFNLDFGYLFIIGISFYKIKSGEAKWWNHLFIALSFLVSFLTREQAIERHFMTLVFIAVFYLFAYGKLKWIKLKPLIILGEISYALYLIHQFIGYVIINKLIKNGVENSIFLILIPSIITIIVAYAITFYIEKPIQLIMRNYFEKYRKNNITFRTKYLKR